MFQFRRAPPVSKDPSASSDPDCKPYNDEITMTASRGLFRRRRSAQSVSRARALELSKRYELSETKDTHLNKKVTYRPGVSMSAAGSLWSVTPQELMKIYNAQKADPLSEKPSTPWLDVPSKKKSSRDDDDATQETALISPTASIDTTDASSTTESPARSLC